MTDQIDTATSLRFVGGNDLFTTNLDPPPTLMINLTPSHHRSMASKWTALRVIAAMLHGTRAQPSYPECTGIMAMRSESGSVHGLWAGPTLIYQASNYTWPNGTVTPPPGGTEWCVLRHQPSCFFITMLHHPSRVGLPAPPHTPPDAHGHPNSRLTTTGLTTCPPGNRMLSEANALPLH